MIPSFEIRFSSLTTSIGGSFFPWRHKIEHSLPKTGKEVGTSWAGVSEYWEPVEIGLFVK